jgi:hypothetical protein
VSPREASDTSAATPGLPPDAVEVSLSPGAVRTTLACLYDRRAALIDHMGRAAEREFGEYELGICQERLRELDEAVEALRSARAE